MGIIKLCIIYSLLFLYIIIIFIKIKNLTEIFPSVHETRYLKVLIVKLIDISRTPRIFAQPPTHSNRINLLHGKWNPKIHCHIHKGSSIPILSRVNPIPRIHTHFLRSILMLSPQPNLHVGLKK